MFDEVFPEPKGMLGSLELSIIESTMKTLNRFKRFWFRFKNQYRIHHHWASLWLIIKIAWAQSKKPKEER